MLFTTSFRCGKQTVLGVSLPSPSTLLVVVVDGNVLLRFPHSDSAVSQDPSFGLTSECSIHWNQFREIEGLEDPGSDPFTLITLDRRVRDVLGPGTDVEVEVEGGGEWRTVRRQWVHPTTRDGQEYKVSVPREGTLREG